MINAAFDSSFAAFLVKVIIYTGRKNISPLVQLDSGRLLSFFNHKIYKKWNQDLISTMPVKMQ